MPGIKEHIRAYRERPYRNIFFALIIVILVDALAPNQSARGLFADFALVALLLLALFETARRGRNILLALAIGLPAITMRIISAFQPDTTAQNTTVLFLSLVFVGYLIWSLLHDLNKTDRPTGEKIFGALCAYVFIGLLFALIYAHIEYREPGSFTSTNDQLSATGVEADLVPMFVYYSFVTLTTLGYGDIAPVAEHVRTLAWLEALLGQLYLAVMVAGFVAVHISEQMKAPSGNPPPEE